MKKIHLLFLLASCFALNVLVAMDEQCGYDMSPMFEDPAWLAVNPEPLFPRSLDDIDSYVKQCHLFVNIDFRAYTAPIDDELFKKLSQMSVLSLNFVQNKFENNKLSHLINHLPCLNALQIIDCGTIALPDSLDKLQNLRTLNLSKTHLSRLPATFGFFKRLHDIDFSHTNFSSLPLSASVFSQLKKIDLSGLKDIMCPMGELEKMLDKVEWFSVKDNVDNREELKQILELTQFARSWDVRQNQLNKFFNTWVNRPHFQLICPENSDLFKKIFGFKDAQLHPVVTDLVAKSCSQSAKVGDLVNVIESFGQSGITLFANQLNSDFFQLDGLCRFLEQGIQNMRVKLAASPQKLNVPPLKLNQYIQVLSFFHPKSQQRVEYLNKIIAPNKSQFFDEVRSKLLLVANCLCSNVLKIAQGEKINCNTVVQILATEINSFAHYDGMQARLLWERYLNIFFLNASKNVNYRHAVGNFLDHGAHVNFKTKEGKTALYFATLHALSTAKDHDIDFVDTLLNYGADPRIQDKQGSSAYDLAAQHYNGELMLMLSFSRGKKKRNQL